MAEDDSGTAAAPAKGRRDYRPAGVSTDTSFPRTARRVFKEFSEDNMTDWAASLTYYGLLSVFPALIAMVSIVGLFGDPAQTTKTLTDIVAKIAPGGATDTFANAIKQITSNRTGAGFAFVLGLAGALWSASGYIGAFTRAANVIMETPEGRPIWKLRPLQLLITLVMVLLTALVGLSLVLTGPIVKDIAGPLGLGSTAVTVWNVAKWPVLVVVVLAMISLLYYTAPNVKQRGFRFVTKGALLALAVWLVASIAFAFYVANFGSYNKTYGTLGGVIGLLVWIWLTNVAILLGMEVNSERERNIEMNAGDERAEREIQLEPRDAPKRQQTT
ncbi:MAG: ribonuclease [Mycobacterium sp.]|jgi:membrane protein|nr:ribonuclease [Mycobacterium sp.]